MLLFKGINLSGLDAGYTRQTEYGFDYMDPPSYEYDYWFDNQETLSQLNSDKINLVRLPFVWERIQSELYGKIDQDYLSLIKEQVQYAKEHGAKIVIDMHNLGRYTMHDKEGNLVHYNLGDPELPVSAFKDVWKKIAVEFKNDDNVIFEFMNEPTKSFSPTAWKDIIQETLLSVREMGVNNQVLISGTFWSTAAVWKYSGNAAAFADFYDPANNYAFDVHQYFDSTQSGTGEDFMDDPTSLLKHVTEWAKATGHKIFLGETAVSLNNPEIAQQNVMKMQEVINYLNKHDDVWLGYSVWGGGQVFKDDYIFRLSPTFDEKGNVISEKDYALWFKSVQSTLTQLDRMWDFKLGSNNSYKKTFEAETLGLSGDYLIENNDGASGGAVVINNDSIIGASLKVRSNSGFYDIGLNYFDEFDGISSYKIKLNGKIIYEFKAEERTKSAIRETSNARAKLLSNIFLNQGDTITVTSRRNINELGAIDSITLSSQDKNVLSNSESNLIGSNLVMLKETDFSDYLVNENNGNLDIELNGQGSFTMIGNGWQSIPTAHQITRNTIASVEFDIQKMGETHAIGFANQNETNNLNENKFFQFAGSQKIGHDFSYDKIDANKSYNFSVNVGKYFTGDSENMVFVNDDDANVGAITSYSNIEFYEITRTARGVTDYNLIFGSNQADRLIGDDGDKDIFMLTGNNIKKVDLLENFNVAEGDKLSVKIMADDLGQTVSQIVANLSLQLHDDSSASLLFQQDNHIHTLALFDDGMSNITLANIMQK